MAQSRRCPTCLTNWPATVRVIGDKTESWYRCPEDGTVTQLMYNEPPIPVDEAESRVKHARFAEYLEQRDLESPELTEADVEQFSAQLLDWNGDPPP